MKARFHGKHALVTGAGSGIGHAVALALAAEGASVRAVDCNEEALDHLLTAAPRILDPCHCDLADRAAWRDLLLMSPTTDILVNCAAVSLPTTPGQRDDPAWAKTFAVNFDPIVESCQRAAETMPTGGRIINISSIQSRLYEINGLAYGVAKAAVEQMTRGMAVELAPRNILVNAVAPGFVDTPMSRASGVNELETAWFHERFIAGGRIPLRRAASPDEISKIVLFLAGPENTYITGQIIVADGGLSLTL